jgi:hypothetical protein
MLRPFFGRPSQESIPFVRAREGGFADAVVTTGRSAAGLYDHSRVIDSIDEERAAGLDPHGENVCEGRWR